MSLGVESDDMKAGLAKIDSIHDGTAGLRTHDGLLVESRNDAAIRGTGRTISLIAVPVGRGREMIETIRQGLKADGIEVSMSKLCQWFGVARRTVYYRP